MGSKLLADKVRVKNAAASKAKKADSRVAANKAGRREAANKAGRRAVIRAADVGAMA